MSLRRLKERLFSSDYKPHSAYLDISFATLLDDLSAPARAVVELILREAGLGAHVELSAFLGLPPLTKLGSELPLERYLSLSDSERAEVLCALTFDLHELTHHIDFLTTPFGANFHCRASNEYIDLQRFVPELLLTAGEGLDRPLVDWHPGFVVTPTPELVSAWRPLRGKLYYFDTFRGSRSSHIKTGWLDPEEDDYIVADFRCRKVRVRDFLYSVEIPGYPGTYLGLRAILESRAVAHSARHLLRLLGGGDLARRELQLYLQCFYPADEIAPDYTFLFEISARLLSQDDFASALRQPTRVVDKFFNVVSVLGWYALQAPPLTRTSLLGRLESSPVSRWLHGLRAFGQLADRSQPFPSNGAMLDAFDRRRQKGSCLFGRTPRLPGIRAILPQTIDYVDVARRRNVRENSDERLRAHFELLLATLQRHLEARIRLGNECDLGMPPSGSPAFSNVPDSIDWEGPSLYHEVHDGVKEWFTFRENLLFRRFPSAAERQLRLEERFCIPQAPG